MEHTTKRYCSSQLDRAVQGLAQETPAAKPVAFIGILASHTHKFIFTIGSKALWRLEEEEEVELNWIFQWFIKVQFLISFPCAAFYFHKEQIVSTVNASSWSTIREPTTCQDAPLITLSSGLPWPQSLTIYKTSGTVLNEQIIQGKVFFSWSRLHINLSWWNSNVRHKIKIISLLVLTSGHKRSCTWLRNGMSDFCKLGVKISVGLQKKK